MLDEDCSKSEEDHDVEVGNITMAKTNNDKKCLKLNQKRKKLNLDSGCSRPMTGTRSLFVSLKAKDGGQITFADNSKARIIGSDPNVGDVPVYQVRGNNSDRGDNPPWTGQQTTTAEYPIALVGIGRPNLEKQSKLAIFAAAKGKRKLGSLSESQITPPNAHGGIVIGKRKRGSLQKSKITPNARGVKMIGKRKIMSLEEESDEPLAHEEFQDVSGPQVDEVTNNPIIPLETTIQTEQIQENPLDETENVEDNAEGYDSDDPFMVLYNKATEPIHNKEKFTIDYRKSVKALGDILNQNLDDIASNPSLRETLLEYLCFFEATPKEAMLLEMRKSLNFISSQCRSILFSYDTSKAILDRLSAFERKKDAMVQSIKEGEKKFKAIRKQQKELLKGREQLDALEDEIALLREELEKKEKVAKQMNESFKTQDTKFKDLRETNEDLKKEASRLDEALDSLLNEYEGVRIESEEAQAEQGHLRSSWQALKVKFDADRPNYDGTSMI